MEQQVTAFFEDRIVARGPAGEVTRRIEKGWPNDQGAIHVFDDADGRAVDLDLWDAGAQRTLPEARPQARGRPRLGVLAREVTLLPRHWEWLARQPGGASATLRRLVEEARKTGPTAGGRDAVYRFVTAMAGDRPGYEQALRALYRGDRDGFRAATAEWPEDIREYAEALLGS
jgi:uncharacterized protein